MGSSFSDKLQNLRKVVAEHLGPTRRSLAEQFDPHDIASKLQDALLQVGWHFTDVKVPNKSKGEIVIKGTKENSFIDVAVAYREDMADVEVSMGRVENIKGISDPESIVQTVVGIAGGKISSAQNALRQRSKIQSEGDVVPGWLRLRNRPSRLSA